LDKRDRNIPSSVNWKTAWKEGQQTKQVHYKNRSEEGTAGLPEGSAVLSAGENFHRKCPVTERLPALMQASSLQLLLSAQFAVSWGFLTMATFLHFAGSAVLLEDRKTTWTGIDRAAVFLRVTHYPKESPRII